MNLNRKEPLNIELNSVTGLRRDPTVYLRFNESHIPFQNVNDSIGCEILCTIHQQTNKAVTQPKIINSAKHNRHSYRMGGFKYNKALNED